MIKDEIYNDGIHNKFTRLYFYLQKGVSLFNEFKDIFLLIFAVYFTLKLGSYWWLVVMFLGSVPILMMVGWYSTHYMSRVIEFLGIKYGTHYSKRQFAITEESLQILKEIKNKL